MFWFPNFFIHILTQFLQLVWFQWSNQNTVYVGILLYPYIHSGWRYIWTVTFTLLYYPMSTALKGLKLLRVCDVQKPGWWVRFSACQQSKSTKMSCCIISFFSLVRIEKIYNRFNKFVQGKTFWQDNIFPLFERMDVLLTKTT